MIEIVPARPNHIATVARRMREMDRLECRVFGFTPKTALRHGLLGASIAWTAKVDGRPEAIFGATALSLIDSTARPWMLMTDEATKHTRALVRLGRLYTAALHRHYDLLQNYVHADNLRSIRWLARLGYAIGGVEMINSQPMRAFIRCADQQPSPLPPLS